MNFSVHSRIITPRPEKKPRVRTSVSFRHSPAMMYAATTGKVQIRPRITAAARVIHGSHWQRAASALQTPKTMGCPGRPFKAFLMSSMVSSCFICRSPHDRVELPRLKYGASPRLSHATEVTYMISP